VSLEHIVRVPEPSSFLECDHWSECGVSGGGCCEAGHYGGRPSIGVCNQCRHRVVNGEAPIAIGETVNYGFASRAAAYLAAEKTHATQGPASGEVQAERTAICKACDGRADVVQGATDPGGIGWCTKCGCGSNRRAALSVKLTLAGATCPLGKWQPVAGTGATWQSVAQAVTGVATSVADQVGNAIKEIREKSS
jgi:hypothetical protein